MIQPGDVISYLDMCREEGVNLQRGMNFRLREGFSVILMSVRKGAPYADRVEAEGRVLIYEGHDIPQQHGGPNPKSVDQPDRNPGGGLTQNGLFFEAAKQFREDRAQAELVRVYEKLRSGIWVYNGIFKLVDSLREQSKRRKVFKFRLEVLEEPAAEHRPQAGDLEQTRLIPASVKLEVWRRDKGKCVMCQSSDNLHFDHIIPYSKGGSSLVAKNIQLLCARHNLAKRDKIE